MESHPPATEPPASGHPSGPAEETSDPSASAAGRIARARRSAEELESRARTEFERARDRHASVRIVVQAFESDRRRAGGLLAGGLAYKVFLWQIPLVLFLVSAFGLVVDLAADDPADLARETGMTAALASAISQAVAASHSARWWLLILGAFLTVWAGRGVYRGVRLVSELAWDAARPEGELAPRLPGGDRLRPPRDRDAGVPAQDLLRPGRAGGDRVRDRSDPRVGAVRVDALAAPAGGCALARGRARRRDVRRRDPPPRSGGVDVLRASASTARAICTGRSASRS